MRTDILTGLLAAALLLAPGCGSDDAVTGSGEPPLPTENGVRISPSIDRVPRDGIWTWVTVPGTRCGQNPAATGMVVNLAPGAPEGLLVFLNGGGACWDQLTCESGLLAGYIDGFGTEHWAEIQDAADAAGNFGYFDRRFPVNPFRDHDMIFLPYCTGDMHAGNTVVTYEDGREMHHVGYGNYGIFLGIVAGAFPDPGHVILAGGSAGGFGSIWNFDRTQAAFEPVPVHLYSGSGIPFGPDVMTEQLMDLWSGAWRSWENVPAACGAPCRDARFDTVFRYNLDAYPQRRFALDSSVADTVVRMILSFGSAPLLPPLIPEETFTEGLARVAQGIREDDNARVFYVDGAFERVGWMDWVNYRTWHVFWKTRPGNPHVQVSGVPDADLAGWLGDFLRGGPGWVNTVPAGMLDPASP